MGVTSLSLGVTTGQQDLCTMSRSSRGMLRTPPKREAKKDRQNGREGGKKQQHPLPQGRSLAQA